MKFTNGDLKRLNTFLNSPHGSVRCAPYMQNGDEITWPIDEMKALLARLEAAENYIYARINATTSGDDQLNLFKIWLKACGK